MSLTHQFIFGIYPYICGALFLLGSLARFDRDQYTWRSESSQMLAMGTLRVGSNLFHLGIIGLFFGHLFGMLTPPEIIHALGVTASQKQMLAVVAGGTLGSIGLIGLLLLIQRRLGNERVRATSRGRDFLVLFWILATLLLGLSTVPLSIQHSDGATMLKLMAWAQHLVTFQGDAPRSEDACSRSSLIRSIDKYSGTMPNGRKTYSSTTITEKSLYNSQGSGSSIMPLAISR